MDIEITKMQLSDLEQIKERIIEEFDDFWTVGALTEELENKNRLKFLLHSCKTEQRNCGLCRNIKDYR